MMETPFPFARAFSASHWVKNRYCTPRQKLISSARRVLAAANASSRRRRTPSGHSCQDTPPFSPFRAMNRA